MIAGIIAIIIGALVIIFSKPLTAIFFIHGGLGTGQKDIPNSKMIGNHIRVRYPPTAKNYYGWNRCGNGWINEYCYWSR